MKLTFIKNADKIDINLHYVDMDEGVVFLPKNKDGFKTFGVSCCIVFVAYYHEKLLCLQHWSPPSSDAPFKKTQFEIENTLSRLENCLSKRGIPLCDVTVYAIGGQESSQTAMDALRACTEDEDNFEVSLNTSYLHLCHDDDFFDFYVCDQKKQFYVLPHFANNILFTEQKTFMPLKILAEVASKKHIEASSSANSSATFDSSNLSLATSSSSTRLSPP
ncbi:MAG: hypothetical protein BGO43_14380 [Gammaproteobacteria bacterium 39-13]|nr:hypothetical protein [Gammaproteobacteria bacterium]OJV95090.1 MAG: hypothetical protein BGO43_14380 [Gammaproteobacteria bacterium 39-13]